MGELIYLNNSAAKKHRAANDPTLRAYCELLIFDSTEQELDPKLTEELLDSSPEKIKFGLQKTYHLSPHEAALAYANCVKQLVDDTVNEVN